jgi:3-hydroxyisobutyrate dehydrogenase-like beta-hydroxyacid dehydrogenase
MGAAIAARLASLGWQVTGWTRSGRAAGSVKTTDDPDDAVASADVILLALLDGPACAQVLDRVRDSLKPGAIVLNTSTIALPRRQRWPHGSARHTSTRPCSAPCQP